MESFLAWRRKLSATAAFWAYRTGRGWREQAAIKRAGHYPDFHGKRRLASVRGLTAGCVSVQHLSLTFEAQLPLGCSDFSARFCDRVTFLKISELDTFRCGVPPCSGEPEHARVLRGVCGERLGPMYLRSGMTGPAYDAVRKLDHSMLSTRSWEGKRPTKSLENPPREHRPREACKNE